MAEQGYKGYIGRDLRPRTAKKTSRRDFLKTVGLGALGLAGAAVVGTEGLKLAGKVAEELEPNYNPGEIYTGTVLVSKGVNIRTSPNISDPGLGPNTVDWGKIEGINGVSLNDADNFSIENPPVYMGFNPNGNGEKSPWIKMSARIGSNNPLAGTSARDIFINIGGQTSKFVQRQGDGSFVPAGKNQEGKFTTTDESIRPEQIGVIKVNSNQTPTNQ